MTPAPTRRSAASWAAPAGVAIPRWRGPRRPAREGRRCAGRHPADGRAHLGRVDVDDGRHREAPLVEAGVVGEGLTEVAGADDHDRPVVGQAELAAHLVREVVDLVADAAGAVGAEVREVLADLRRVDAGQLGQPLGRHAGHPIGGEVVEDPQVDGQPGHGGLRDPSAPGVAHGRRLGTTCIRSQGSRREENRRADEPEPRPRSHTATTAGAWRADRRPREDGAVILAELTLDAALAATATLVATAFAAAVLERWLVRRRPHELAWTISLLMFAAASAALWLAEAGGGRADLPRLLPVRRHPERAVAGARDGLPAGRAAPGGRRAVGPRHRVRLRGRGDGDRAHARHRPRRRAAGGRDLFAPLPASWRPSGRGWPPSS